MLQLDHLIEKFASSIQRAAFSSRHTWDTIMQSLMCQLIFLVCRSNDNTKFLSCGEDKPVLMWDVATGQIIRRLWGHDARVNCVVQNREGSLVFTGSFDQRVFIWDVRTPSQKPLQVIGDAKDSVSSISLVEGRETLLHVASIDERVRTYDIRMGQCNEDFLGVPVTCVSSCLNGRGYAVSSLDDTIRIMDHADGEMLSLFKGHRNGKFRLESCVSYDDSFIVGGSEDHVVYVWDFMSCELLDRLKHHRDAVTTTACHADQMILCGSLDRTASVWVRSDMLSTQ
eukprot:TRINITY_DN176_c0_g1_i13.p1 TRINITY_DN176_c0_g1~~TRINITY_DN176_c0_g1_i13.p1  ORF type:complete len:284 (-),score=73.97 TRINITY_DN176_c0_g1_i13:602-1453(-)